LGNDRIHEGVQSPVRLNNMGFRLPTLGSFILEVGFLLK
jgi:hypothetical protein